MNILDIITCPVCGSSLSREGGALKCPAGHSHDISKSGYINMLPPGKKNNAHTGDDRDMVKARTSFLKTGAYSPISAGLASRIAEYAGENAVLCDMGCGEGWHTLNIIKNLPYSCTAVAFDASKYAAECGNKAAKAEGLFPHDGIGEDCVGSCAYFFPGNIFSLPVKDVCADFAVSMFAPVPGSEAFRILKDGGVLAVVSSGREHLREMREIIYDEVRMNDNPPSCPEGFTELSRDTLSYKTVIEGNENIKNLFTMTPFYFRTAEAGRERLFSRESLEVTVEVCYSLFRKHADCEKEAE